MADKMKGMQRTDYAGTLRACDAGRTVTVCGWVQRVRRLGGLIFVTLRDRSGLLQCNFNQENNAALFEKADSLRSEYVAGISGTIALRGEGAVNPNMPTGEIELIASDLRIFAKSETPPFEILDDVDVNEPLRLKYRYLDLRRPVLQNTLMFRHKVTQVTRNFFSDNGFLEIETPMLTKSTPEGARDYLVPSRVHPGKFYALPQSPQQYKQLLMLSGFDRYIQIARCFRDEDLRADRQPEFTQIDLEMSFVDVEDVLDVNERFLQKLFKECLDVDVQLPIRRMPYREAMEKYGSDKPDLRFGMEIIDLTDIVKDSTFKVFADACATGSVRMLNVSGAAAKFTRKELDSLGEYVKTYRAKGLMNAKINADGTVSSSFVKHITPEMMNAIIERAEGKPGDLLLIIADTDNATALTATGALRLECGRRLGLMDPNNFQLLWVTEFPMFEFSEEDGRLVAVHHPFTAPMDEDIELLETDPQSCRAKAYDIVLNGTEMGGGSIRINDSDLQAKMFRIMGFTQESIEERFGHLITAFKYGVPPHGGLAYGLDRVVMLLSGRDSIRDTIAFPKVQTAAELMMGSPDVVDEKQLRELSIDIDLPEA